MKTSHTIPESERDTVKKLFVRLEKKAKKYGQVLGVVFGEPYATSVAVHEVTVDEHGVFFEKKVGSRLVEAFDLTIESEIICKAGYTILAKIEHLDGGNFVYNLTDEEHPEWSIMPAKCDHCGGNHGQKTTFIVRNDDGDMKQVGRTCLKDYCGIDPQYLASLKQLTDIYYGLDVEHYDFVKHKTPSAYSAIDVLALSYRLYKKFGYTATSYPNSNKERLIDLVRNNEAPTEEETAWAYQVSLEILAAKNDEEIWYYTLNNIWAIVRSGYCKIDHFGYIAYAPKECEKWHAWLEEKKRRDEEKASERKTSEYVGNIGQRLTIDVAEINLLTSWDTQWGYTFLYKIIDTFGNVLIWYASKSVDTSNTRKVKATVKEHSERDGVKQTIVTRCAVVAA